MVKKLAVVAGLITSGCVSVPSRAQDGICRASPVPNQTIESRSLFVKFPDGRVIYLVGHIHGDRQMLNFNQLVQTGQLNQITNEKFSVLLKEILKKNRADFPAFSGHSETVLKQAKEDQLFLRDLSTAPNGSRIAFVGLESFPDEAQKWIDQSRNTFSILRLEHEARKKNFEFDLSEEDFRDFLVSSTSAAVYELITEPNRYHQITFVGTESNEMKETELVLLNGFKQMMASLTKMSSEYIDGPDFLAGSKAIGPSFVSPSELIKDFAAISAQIQRGELTERREIKAKLDSLPLVPPKYQHYVQEAKESLLIFVDAAIDREVQVTKNLTTRRENGVQFIGLLHLRRLGRNLEQLCEREK